MDARAVKEVVIDDRQVEPAELHKILDYYRDQTISNAPFRNAEEAKPRLTAVTRTSMR